jgi:hypothetical protein
VLLGLWGFYHGRDNRCRSDFFILAGDVSRDCSGDFFLGNGGSGLVAAEEKGSELSSERAEEEMGIKVLAYTPLLTVVDVSMGDFRWKCARPRKMVMKTTAAKTTALLDRGTVIFADDE